MRCKLEQKDGRVFPSMLHVGTNFVVYKHTTLSSDKNISTKRNTCFNSQINGRLCASVQAVCMATRSDRHSQFNIPAIRKFMTSSSCVNGFPKRAFNNTLRSSYWGTSIDSIPYGHRVYYLWYKSYC